MKNYKYTSTLVLISLTFFVVSCQQKVNSSANKAENSISIDKKANELEALAHSLELTEAEYKDLKSELKSEENKNKLYYRKIHLLQSELDSIKTQSNALKEVIARYETVDAPSLSEDEQDIALLVHHLHASWKKMTETKNENEVLQYFLPKFIVNQVLISGQSKGKVESYTHEDYINHLKKLSSREGYSYEFGDVEFLDIIIKNKTFFNVVYKCVIRTYKDDDQLHSSSFVVTITGKKQEDEWKIGNYSIVSFKYQEMMNIVF